MACEGFPTILVGNLSFLISFIVFLHKAGIARPLTWWIGGLQHSLAIVALLLLSVEE